MVGVGIPMLLLLAIFVEDLLHHPITVVEDPDGMMIDTMIAMTIVVHVAAAIEALHHRITEDGDRHHQEDHLHHAEATRAMAESPFGLLKKSKNGWKSVVANVWPVNPNSISHLPKNKLLPMRPPWPFLILLLLTLRAFHLDATLMPFPSKLGMPVDCTLGTFRHKSQNRICKISFGTPFIKHWCTSSIMRRIPFCQYTSITNGDFAFWNSRRWKWLPPVWRWMELIFMGEERSRSSGPTITIQPWHQRCIHLLFLCWMSVDWGLSVGL
mmetsp:Transcript_21210/g.52188  ORF Transcript_21210/g.52188 Transcript_21210/m.52188 type:complete len:269 (+) Transcript_21210:297-1103(+)